MSRVTCNSSYWKSQNSRTSQPDFGQFWMVNGQWQDSVIPAWILDRYYTQHLECYFTYYGNKRNNFIYLHLKFSSSFNATYNNLDLNWKYFYYIQILGCVFWWTSSNYHVTSKSMIHSPTNRQDYGSNNWPVSTWNIKSPSKQKFTRIALKTVIKQQPGSQTVACLAQFVLFFSTNFKDVMPA